MCGPTAPPGDVVHYGWRVFADAAHSVPLDMAAGGGLPLLGTYLMLVGFVGRRLLKGLFELKGERLHLLGGFGGVWTAYQAQSLVSIDMSFLAALHFLSAGAILALTSPAVGGSLPLRSFEGRHHGPPGWAQQMAVIAVAVPIIGFLSLHIVADRYNGLAVNTVRTSPATAVRYAAMATRFFPWQPEYWATLGNTRDLNQEPDAALHAHLEAVRRDPRDVLSLVDAANAASWLGRKELQRTLIRRALVLEPQAADIRVWAAVSEMNFENFAEAGRLLVGALELDREHPEAQELLRAVRAKQRS